MIDDLKYLRMGGRLSAAGAVMGPCWVLAYRYAAGGKGLQYR